MNKMCPEKKYQKRKNSNGWMTEELKAKMLDRDLLRVIARVSNLPDDWKKYKTAKNQCVSEIKQVKNNHMNKIYEKMKEEKMSRVSSILLPNFLVINLPPHHNTMLKMVILSQNLRKWRTSILITM